MGRGRSQRPVRSGMRGLTRQGVAPRATSASWADPGLPRDMEGLRALVEAETAASLHKQIQARLTESQEPNNVPASGPHETPNSTEYAPFQAAAAAYALNPNDPTIMALLRKMLDLQHAQLREFDVAMRGRQHQATTAIFRLYGLDTLSGAKRRESRDWIIRSLKKLLGAHRPTHPWTSALAPPAF